MKQSRIRNRFNDLIYNRRKYLLYISLSISIFLHSIILFNFNTIKITELSPNRGKNDYLNFSLMSDLNNDSFGQKNNIQKTEKEKYHKKQKNGLLRSEDLNNRQADKQRRPD